jgi:hypothetical protein
MEGENHDFWEDFEREPANPLPLLHKWFARQCNGDWEHRFGIRIETYDNPGWWVKIDLEGTSLNPHAFSEVAENVDSDGHASAPKWLRCYRDGNVWHGAGDPTKLNNILLAFLNWAAEVNPGWPTH